jgi:hypothetical protein
LEPKIGSFEAKGLQWSLSKPNHIDYNFGLKFDSETPYKTVNMAKKKATAKKATKKAAAKKTKATKATTKKAAGDAEEAPKKKKKKRKSRKKAEEVIRRKVFWGVFNHAMKRVAKYEFNQRKAADKRASELSPEGKPPHFVQKIKEDIVEIIDPDTGEATETTASATKKKKTTKKKAAKKKT